MLMKFPKPPSASEKSMFSTSKFGFDCVGMNKSNTANRLYFSKMQGKKFHRPSLPINDHLGKYT